MKNKTQSKNFIYLFSLLFLLIPFFSQAETNLKYTPLENIPGFEQESKTGDFYDYIQAVYKFGIWAVGIAALLMITIGGFMYITSAGNNSSMEKAKSVITDAIIGLVLALTSYLILYVINPDLVNIQKLKPIGTTSTTGGAGGTGGGGGGTCSPAPSGPCSVDNLKNTCFGSNAEKASAICYAESGGNETIPSGVDKCEPNKEPVSYGLFQINISANKVNGLNCPATTGAFDKVYTSANHACSIINPSLYLQCQSAATTASFNIATACNLSSNGTKWSAWGANSKCKF